MTHPGATPSDKHKVVIIGSGFGGLTAAQKLKRADVDIKLIAKTTHHLFQPLLYQVATGIISEGEIAPHPRGAAQPAQRQVLLGEVTHIDLANQTVDSLLLGHTYRTPYDTLIIAAGAGQSYFGNDQFAEWAPGMKTIDDALGCGAASWAPSNRPSGPAIRCREKLLTFVVVGAGRPASRWPGRSPNLDHTLKGAFRHIDSTQARMILIDGADAVLPPMGPKLGRRRSAGWRDGRRDPARRHGHRRRSQRSDRQVQDGSTARIESPPRCGRPVCRPARWARTWRPSPVSSSIAPAGSRCCPT
jgi:NADH dehydrogenase